MSGPDDPDSFSAAKALIKRALFARVDAELDAAGPPAAPAPAPAARPAPPELTFEAWAEMVARFQGASHERVAAVLAEKGLTLAAWLRINLVHRRALDEDLRAAGGPLSAIYNEKIMDEVSGRAGLRRAQGAQGAQGAPAAPTAAEPRATPGPQPAPDPMRGTANVPDMSTAAWQAQGRTPFLPAAPAATPGAPAANGKGSAKTEKSMRAVPSAMGRTLPLDCADLVERRTPSLPFAGCPAGDGVLALPERKPMEMVALTLEKWLKATSLEVTLRRYFVLNEAGYRALVALHREPGRREKIVEAIEELRRALYRDLLGE